MKVNIPRRSLATHWKPCASLYKQLRICKPNSGWEPSLRFPRVMLSGLDLICSYQARWEQDKRGAAEMRLQWRRKARCSRWHVVTGETGLLLTTAPGINCWQQLTASTSIYGRQHLGSGDSNCTALLRTLEVVMEGSNTDPKNVKQEFHIFLHISPFVILHSMISCSWCNMCAGAVRVAQLILSSTHSCTLCSAQSQLHSFIALHHLHCTTTTIGDAGAFSVVANPAQ